jgi:DegV family protein with EDD domain
MNNTFQIVTDSSCDLPQNLIDDYGLVVLPLSVTVDGKSYRNYADGREISFETLYAKLRAGIVATTSAVSPGVFSEAMEAILQSGRDVLYIGFSTGLSTTYQSGCIAAEELRGKYPDRKILTVDSLCASLGQGLLIHHAVLHQRADETIEQVRDFLEENKLHLCHWFTVDDLMFLKRGGRIPATTALLGTLLKIKPVMHMDNEGKLAPVGKVRGRKASLDAMAEKMAETAIRPEEQAVFISHGDCREDAEYLAGVIRQKFGIQDIVINFVGPVIGAHSGPGTVALFFLGTQR